MQQNHAMNKLNFSKYYLLSKLPLHKDSVSGGKSEIQGLLNDDFRN